MYSKTTWVARVGTALNRFLKSNETDNSVELTNDPTGVSTAGTPFTVANMNKIEEGIEAVSSIIDSDQDGTNNISTTGTITAGEGISGASLKLSYSTPFIDFHYNNSTEDFTSRIIESSSGTLEFTGNVKVGGSLYVSGSITSDGLAIQTVSAGNYQKENLTSSVQRGEDTYQDAGITIRVPSNIKGVIRLKLNLNFSSGVSGTTQTHTRTYKNGALLYTDNFADDNIQTSTINFTHDVSVSAGDYFTFTTYSDESNTRTLTASLNISEYLW